MSRYFRADYVRLNFLKTVFYTAIGFFTVCLLYAIVRYDSFIDDVFEIDYEKIGMLVGLVFLAVLVGSLILTWLVYTIKYIRSRKRLAAYYRMLRQINIFNEEDMQLKKLEDK